MIGMRVLRAGGQHQRGFHLVEHALKIAFEIFAIVRRARVQGRFVDHRIRAGELRTPGRVRVVVIQQQRQQTAIRVAEKEE
jgi:hypothetical protein